MLAETWYSAEEAVIARLADSVAETPQPKNSHDLSVFQYAGREDAPGPGSQAINEADPPAPPLARRVAEAS